VSERITAKIDDWIKAEMDGASAVALPELAKRGREHFLSDTHYLQALFADQLQQLIYQRAQTLFGRTRRGAVLLGDEMVDAQEFARRAGQLAARLSAKWEGWLEHVGERHLALTSMTRAQLLAAAAEREARAEAESRRAAFLRGLAAGLEGERTVGQTYSIAEIERRWWRARRDGEAAA